MKATFCNLVFCVHLHLLVLELLGRWEVGWQTVSSKDMHWIEVFTSWLFMPDCYWLSFFKLYLLIWIFIDFHFWECILRRTTVDFSECQIWCYSKLHLYAICIQMHSSIRWQCYLGPIAVFCFGCVTCLNMIYFPSFSFMLLNRSATQDVVSIQLYPLCQPLYKWALMITGLCVAYPLD